ncbi:MAG: hypothetical protein KIT54_11670 [Phycisphaeraceae bacterium]|nr:hypothetical protein [Phycisphaeraceae bacterium]
MQEKQGIVCVAAVVFGLAGVASSQLAPPRGDPKPEPPTQLPDSTPTPAPVPGADPELGRPVPPTLPPPFKFEKIFEVDADGNPVAPARWPDLLALTRNPRLTADQRSSIETVVRQWLANIERLVVQNPDLILEVAQGLFENIDLKEQGILAHASEVMRALGTTGNLTALLSTSGVLSTEQAEANRTIVQDYAQARNLALTKELMAMPAEEQQQHMQLLMAKMTMIGLSEDAMRMFNSVALRGARHARAALQRAGIDPSPYASELTALERSTTESQAVESMVSLMAKIEHRRLFAFSEALGQLLPPIELPEIAQIGNATGGG